MFTLFSCLLFKPIFHDVMALKPLYDSITTEANEISKDPKPEDEEDEVVEKKLPEVKQHWDDVLNTVTKYNNQLTSVMPTEGNYHYTLLKFVPWLEDAEKKLTDLKRDATKMDENELPKQIKSFQQDVVKNQPVHQDYNTSATNLLKKCGEVDVTTDVPFIKDEVQHTNDRWDKLRAGIDDVNSDSAKLNKSLKDLQKAREPVEECIQAMTVAADHETPANFDLDGLEFFVNEMNANLETMQEKEPEVKDVNKKSDDISAFIEQRGGDPSDVKQKCADTNKQWNDAKEKVTDKRDKSQMFLKQMAQFVEAVDDLDNWVNVSTTTVTNLGPASATPEGVKKQLEQIDILKDEIAGQQAKLAEAEEIGDWLCDESKDKPQFCANVQNKLNKVKKPLDELLSVLSDRKTRLHNVLVANQDFKVAFDDFVSELDKLDNKQTKQKPISVDWKTLKLQDEEQKAVEKEIEVVKPMYEKLMASGDKLVKESEKSPERDALESNLEDAKKRFEGIVKKSTERRDVMDKVIPKSEKFFNDEDDICDWLDVNEKVLQELNVVPVTLDEATKLDKKIDELDKVIAKEEPVYKSTAGSSKDLLASAANENVVRDVPETEKRMDRVTERWEKFKTEKTNKKDRTLRYKTLIQNYNDTADPLKDALAQFEDALDKRPTFGTDTKKAVDELQRIDDLIRKLDTHEPQLKSVDKTNDDLVDLVETDKGDPSRIQFQTDNINDRFKKIKSALDERKNALEKTSRVLVQFNDITKEIGDWCVDTNEQVDTLAPVSKDPEEAQKQIKKIDVSLILNCFIFPVRLLLPYLNCFSYLGRFLFMYIVFF